VPAKTMEVLRSPWVLSRFRLKQRLADGRLLVLLLILTASSRVMQIEGLEATPRRGAHAGRPG
jgi:hypothetical protein